ncbi:MAG TPA: hypothetical protein VJP86_10440 [Vicinamibacterales bacterium]|jgi:glucose-6-phosphate isomerase|nr:hypothetical protein [Vicinamibacterales bacterium]
MIDRASSAIAEKRAQLASSCRLIPGSLTSAFEARADAAARAAAGLFARDPRTWSADAAVQQKISNRLGWLDSPSFMMDKFDRLRRVAEDVVRDGVTDIVLLGMGGSSLAPEVLRSVIGVASDRPRFQMLDSTDPTAVANAETPPARTLYVFASKSGGTIEPNSMAAYFQSRLAAAGVKEWGRHFIAITDEGTALAERARRDKFREVFINPSDIGGRYSALSYFGLVPAALMGQDLEALVAWGRAMADAAEGAPNIMINPAAALGLALGAAALAGRDKMTLLLPPNLAEFGLWAEQLIAESTGKNDVGILPVAGEDEGGVDDYGPDRIFVSLRTAADPVPDIVHELTRVSAPIIELILPDRMALGAEFMRWEIATAVAGALLGINPFDEPNVQQAKDATRTFLSQYESRGHLPVPHPASKETDAIATVLSSAAGAGAAPGTQPMSALLSQIHGGDYVALLAYLGPDPAFTNVLHEARARLRRRFKVATTVGWGPRYLHSTGQLHKGGPNSGVFVLISAAPRVDVAIPGEPFSFGTLELAQALGDFASLDAARRRAIHIHLPRPDASLLAKALDTL